MYKNCAKTSNLIIKPVCLNCQNRHYNCHSNCGDYKEFLITKRKAIDDSKQDKLYSAYFRDRRNRILTKMKTYIKAFGQKNSMGKSK